MTYLVGGVGELYQGDLDVGRHLVDRLTGTLPSHVRVEELHYGAVAVSQLLDEIAPDALVLAGAIARGGPPGAIRRRRLLAHPAPSPDEAHQAIQQATTGYVDLDLIVTSCSALGSLPARTILVEVEPGVIAGPAETLSPTVAAALDEAEMVIRRELDLLPVMVLSDRLRHTISEGHLAPAPALESVDELLAGLDVLDECGRWTTVFRSRDRLRRRIADGTTGDGMDHLDWGIWWSLIEELDRLEHVDTRSSD